MKIIHKPFPARLVLCDTDMKFCYGCRKFHARTFFPCTRNAADGKHPYCRDCVKIRNSERCARYVSSPRIIPEHKYCPSCHLDLPSSAFARCPTSVDALSGACKKCRSSQARIPAYGLTAAAYAQMARERGGVCDICGRPETLKGKTLSVDHCHTTGVIRGLLCAMCNKGLGLFGDDVSRLSSAIEYLDQPVRCVPRIS